MANRFLRTAGASVIVRKLAAKAVLERGLIADGDRILIAASGGKDSTVMAWALSALRNELKKSYELEALHISSDFCACCKKPALSERLNEWGIPFKDLFVPVIGRLKEGEKMNCYWCSTQRRTELLKYAVENGFNKIALGHHLDDIIETFFMNMTAKGDLSTMPMVLAYRKYPVSLIRPLGYVEESQIVACAEEKGILKMVCACPYGLNSARREVRKQIAEFTGNSGAVKRRIFKALSAGQRDMLVGG
jgi:tRNA 2-thiocytidine biosynthesis protein TtcA